MNPYWTAYQIGDSLEYTLEPDGDVIEHGGPYCECDPTARPVALTSGEMGVLYIHRAADGRPANEQAETILIDHLEGRCDCGSDSSPVIALPPGSQNGEETARVIILPIRSLVAGGKLLTYGAVTITALVHLWKLLHP